MGTGGFSLRGGFGLRGLLDGLLTDPARYGGERARTGEDH
ncbi:hypothetical protein FHU34_113132 [Micromonospora taraxaci]|uniref:Uncharacterized protein n=1 Tax=Micromonospora taraxaci TaxID=1316803 RepID=A0A561W1P2_9ACTN|nr:hypothetical protein FHU34_113132 [Micromonospora taraxaci]